MSLAPGAPAAVLVPYRFGAASPAQVWRAVAGRWRIVFLYSGSDRPSPEVLEILGRFGVPLDLDELGYEAVVERARSLGVRGVVTFDEQLVRSANALARDLDCVSNPPEAVLNVTDKARQRRALNEAGVSVTRFATLEADSLGAAVDVVGLPAVLKPRLGGASRGVALVETPAAIAAAVDGNGSGWLLEELLLGAPRPGEPWVGDYVSVEMLSVRGRHALVGVSDKLPPAPDFRERGVVTPSGLPTETRHELAKLTRRALDALGIENGMTHSELKPTPEGPRLIEINGRLGGFVQRLFTRGSDTDPAALALEVAMGGAVWPPEASFHSHVAAVTVAPPLGAVRLLAAAEPARLRRLPGVWQVEEHTRPGDRVDTPLSPPFVQVIGIEAASRPELAERIRAVQAEAQAGVEFE